MDGKRPEDLLSFPYDYMFKAFGPNEEAFAERVRAAVGTIVPISLDAVRVRSSRQGVYACVSVLVHLHNFDQLSGIYGALRRVEDLKYLL